MKKEKVLHLHMATDWPTIHEKLMRIGFLKRRHTSSFFFLYVAMELYSSVYVARPP